MIECHTQVSKLVVYDFEFYSTWNSCYCSSDTTLCVEHCQSAGIAELQGWLGYIPTNNFAEKMKETRNK